MKFENTLVSNFSGAFRGMRNPLNSWDKTDSEIGIGSVNDLYDAESGVVPAWILNENKDIEYYSEEYEDLYKKYCDWIDENGILRDFCDVYDYAFIGPKDMKLAQKLVTSGPEHCKFLRQIQVCVDITAPLYWWKEFDTYKVATTANSTSTMHTLTKTPITIDKFEFDNLDLETEVINGEVINEKTLEKVDEFNTQFYFKDDIETILETCERLRQKYIESEDKRYWRALVEILPEAFLQTRTITLSYANLRNIYFQRKNHKLIEWHQFCDWVKTLPYANELIILEDTNENSKTN